jgi:hypothetical protein
MAKREKPWFDELEFATYPDAIDAWVEHEREENEKVEREPKFYASDFGTCHRKLMWKRDGVPGRPMTVDSMRNLEERGHLHNHRIHQLFSMGQLLTADSGSEYVKRVAPTRLSDGLPDGFGCRADAIGHLHCGCGGSTFSLRVHWGKMARLSRVPGMENKAEMSRRRLMGHLLDCVEVKTSHPNQIRYAGNLPKPHHVLQVRTGAYAARCLYRLELRPLLLYFAVGSGAKSLEFVCGGGKEDQYLDVQREIATLQQEWDMHQEDGSLPAKKPLMLTKRKDGRGKNAGQVAFLEDDWECDTLYCPYCKVVERRMGEDGKLENVYDGCGCCDPNQSVNKTGDRLGYYEEDGSITYVRSWVTKVPEYAPLLQTGVTVIDKPRKEED